MSLHWLKINRPCTLEIPQVKDYAGQPLVFRPPGLLTRCVTHSVFESAMVKHYRSQLLLVEVDGNGAVIAPKAAPVVPAVAVTPAAPVPAKKPEPKPEPVVAPAKAYEPEPAPVVPVSVETPAASVSTEDAPSKGGDDGKGFELKRRRRN